MATKHDVSETKSADIPVPMSLWKRTRSALGKMYTCPKENKHTKSLLVNSLFSGTHTEIHDLILFVYHKLDGLT